MDMVASAFMGAAAGILLISAAAKLRSADSATAFLRGSLLPTWVAVRLRGFESAVGYLLVTFEFGLAAGLLFSSAGVSVALAGLVFMTFGLLAWRALSMDGDTQCGCLGETSLTVGRSHVYLNVGIAIAASIVLILQGSSAWSTPAVPSRSEMLVRLVATSLGFVYWSILAAAHLNRRVGAAPPPRPGSIVLDRTVI